MERKKLIGLMICAAILGVIAGFLRLGGDITDQAVNIFQLIFGVYLVNFGMKLDKKSPDMTVNVFRSVKRGKFIAICGSLMFILGLMQLIISSFLSS